MASSPRSTESISTARPSRAEAEIVDLHRFLESWLRGRLPKERSVFDQLAGRLDPEGVIIQPSGSSVSLRRFAAWLWDAHGTNPEFRIQIRAVRTIESFADGAELARYEEWQKGAKNSVPPNNARVVTALFENSETAPNRLRWRHIHETDLPAAIVGADPFDF